MDTDMTSSRGGTRRKAGRPKANSGLTTKSYVLHPSDVERVESHRIRYNMSSVSEAMRDIIRTYKDPK